MNVSLINSDSVSAIIKIQIAKGDYQEKVEKAIKNFRQKANVPGFRKGMVPAGLVKKMYGKSILAEEINKLVSEQLFSHIRENKINILGEPLPNTTEQQVIDFDTQEEFEFCFDLGLSPTIDFDLAKISVPYYSISVSDEMIEQNLEMFRGQHGSMEQADTVEEKDMVKGQIAQVDENGEVIEGGMSNDAAVIMPAYLRDADAKALFLGGKTGTTVTFDLAKACENNASEMSHILGVSKEEAAAVSGNVKFTIMEVSRRVPAPLSQELFDKIYGEGVITSEADFRERVKVGIAKQMSMESDGKFWLDARPAIEEALGTVVYPDAFLKRWLLASGENKTEASVEEEYPSMIGELTWHLIKENISKKNEVKVEEADIMETSKQITRYQFTQYGMNDIPEELLENYAQGQLKDEKTRRSIIERAMEVKLIEKVKSLVTLNEKSVTVDEFNNLFEAN